MDLRRLIAIDLSSRTEGPQRRARCSGSVQRSGIFSGRVSLQAGEGALRDRILIGLNVGEEPVVRFPHQRHNLDPAAGFGVEAYISRGLGFDEEIAVRETPRRSAIVVNERSCSPSDSAPCATSGNARYPASRERNSMKRRCRMNAKAWGSAYKAAFRTASWTRGSLRTVHS